LAKIFKEHSTISTEASELERRNQNDIAAENNQAVLNGAMLKV
jgi:hypothetical protein